MYFVRTPCEWGMDAISATLTFLWEVVGYVEGLFFKDLKQTMKKEQCEVKLLVTASMPGDAASQTVFSHPMSTDTLEVDNISLLSTQGPKRWWCTGRTNVTSRHSFQSMRTLSSKPCSRWRKTFL